MPRRYSIKKQDTWLPERFFREHLLHFPLVTVDLVIRDSRSRFLLVKRSRNNFGWKGAWATPGGRIFRSEKSNEAAHRVLLRETGIDITPSDFRLRGAQDNMTLSEHAVTLIFSARTTQTEVRLDETSSSAGWFTARDAPKSLRALYREILATGGVKLG